MLCYDGIGWDGMGWDGMGRRWGVTADLMFYFFMEWNE